MHFAKNQLQIDESSPAVVGEKMFIMRRTEIFRALSNADLLQMARLLRTFVVEAGQVIARQGALDQDVFILRSGSVRVECDGQPVSALSAGSVLGEIAAVDAQPRSGTVIALETSTLYKLSAVDFLTLIEERPAFAAAVIEVLCSRLRSRMGS